MSNEPIAVIGAGSWGTALAMVLSRTGRKVRLVTRTEEEAEKLNEERQNKLYLPDIPFPESLWSGADYDWALHQVVAVVVAVPCSSLVDVLPRLSSSKVPVICASKGIDPMGLKRTDEMMAEHIDLDRILLLSGPSFALEVARGQPTAITMASSDIRLAEKTATLFDDTNFRIYTNDDLVGVALGGALKNVIAIAAGVAEGLRLGHNSVSAAVTRGLAEMARLSCACGGRHETLMGLSGLGDLVLTCTGSLSRNRRLGMLLAEGMTPKEAQLSIQQAVEGVRTAEAVDRLALSLGIEVPLMQAVARVLRGELDIREAVTELMSRPERREFE